VAGNVVDVGVKETLERARTGSANLRFGEMRRLLEAVGFRLARVSGSHHIFSHRGMRELVNLQEVDGKCKPYQLKQVLKLIDRYNLSVGDEP
jgi:predicted RNA binding protein YcfA (HicA-like mRNA interferase family)